MRGNFSAFFDGIVAVCSAIFRACEYSHENRQAFASAAAIPPHAKPTGFRIVRR